MSPATYICLLMVLSPIASHENIRFDPNTSPRDLFSFWSGVGEYLRGDATDGADPVIASFAPDQARSFVAQDSDRLPEILQGIWWWKDHPSMGQVVFSMYGGLKPFVGTEGTDTNYSYVSLIRPRAFAVPDQGKNRTDLIFNAKHGLEMSFPKFNMSVGPATATYVNTKMTFPFEKIPLPAMMAEGWDWKDAEHWHPNASTVAKCFCSLTLQERDVIERFNFGKHAYWGYRLVDENGNYTKHWEKFLETTRLAGIESFIAVDAWPKKEEPKNNSPPAHPDVHLFFDHAFKETMVKEEDGNVVATGEGTWASTYGGFDAPLYLLAAMEITIRFKDADGAGVALRNVTWLGRNNVVTKDVTRYLLVRDMDAAGRVTAVSCATYPDKDPDGMVDPAMLMAGRYNLHQSLPSGLVYRYQWTLVDGRVQTADMSTPLAGGPPQKVIIVTEGRGPSTKFTYTYSNESSPVRTGRGTVFDDYKAFEHTCTHVGNFTPPTVCIDSWLNLQYEC